MLIVFCYSTSGDYTCHVHHGMGLSPFIMVSCWFPPLHTVNIRGCGLNSNLQHLEWPKVINYGRDWQTEQESVLTALQCQVFLDQTNFPWSMSSKRCSLIRSSVAGPFLPLWQWVCSWRQQNFIVMEDAEFSLIHSFFIFIIQKWGPAIKNKSIA